MESSLFGGPYKTQTKKRWEWRENYSQRYSWGLGCNIVRRAVRNRVIDGKCNSAIGVGFRPIELEDTIAKERQEEVMDVLWEEEFCETNDVQFIDSSPD